MTRKRQTYKNFGTLSPINLKKKKIKQYLIFIKNMFKYMNVNFYRGGSYGIFLS
ncbi:hypothetical protein SULYE_0239 [Sulfurihydrogenibium yellowstonense SS-5]|uniref:Uncharacterized protein n=1 Tax=Sulfurihydrogenibium yellowstonense SS-5 TaxID=432331 RepID=C4FI55_9AQUI|nr:hypothetical protein SULYE_0239 [Sulfurihydrogenibium yellowstonense SS-5]